MREATLLYYAKTMNIHERFSLAGHVAVVTGGGRGIGEGIARDFASAGAAVVLAARRTHEIEKVAEDINNVGGQALAVTTDVLEEGAIEALGEATMSHFGKMTIWVNNAGGSTHRVPLTTLPREEWQRTMRLNVDAVYEGCMTAARHMDKGCIINITSGAGSAPVPNSAHYGAAKAAVNSLTASLSVELAPNIRVNAVAPGAIPTELMLTVLEKTEDELNDILEEWNIPLGRLGTPQDIGSACVYLASDAASWLTGEVLRVGGGARPH